MGAVSFARYSGSRADGAEFPLPAPSGNGEQYRGVAGIATFSTSYATGGDTFDLAEVGLAEVREILVDPIGVGTADGDQSGLSVKLGGTPGAPTLMAYDSDNTQVTATTNLSTRSPVAVWLLGH